mmetsp:Transcript_17901/g.38698  ORF Transcript_17901/g.38698 Transcript_17901/m.38698 type:complete len:305 (-) Transcript_17901:67-981(-)
MIVVMHHLLHGTGRPIVRATWRVSMIVVMRRVGFPHAWNAVMMTMLISLPIVSLGCARLHFTLFAINNDISSFTRDGREDGVRIVLTGKGHKSKATASLGNTINHYNGINYFSKLLEELKEGMVRHICRQTAYEQLAIVMLSRRRANAHLLLLHQRWWLHVVQSKVGHGRRERVEFGHWHDSVTGYDLRYAIGLVGSGGPGGGCGFKGGHGQRRGTGRRVRCCGDRGGADGSGRVGHSLLGIGNVLERAGWHLLMLLTGCGDDHLLKLKVCRHWSRALNECIGEPFLWVDNPGSRRADQDLDKE